VCGRVQHGVALLGKHADSLTHKVKIHVSKASQSAIRKIESLGGEVRCVYMNATALRAHLHPYRFHPSLIPRGARPPPRLMPYYTNWEKRGYLSAEAQLEDVRRRIAAEEHGLSPYEVALQREGGAGARVGGQDAVEQV